MVRPSTFKFKPAPGANATANAASDRASAAEQAAAEATRRASEAGQGHDENAKRLAALVAVVQDANARLLQDADGMRTALDKALRDTTA